MEKSLDRQLDDVLAAPGVTGVLCADAHGLCLGAKGSADKKSSGIIANLVQQASKLNPDSKEPPVISIESDVGAILINSHENITTAIYKAQST